MALLQDNLWPAVLRDNMRCGTVVETDTTSSRSAVIASCFLELEKLNQEFKGKLRDDFITILDGMSSIRLSSTLQPPSPSLTPPSRPSSLVHGSAFITEAHSWLLENVAHPYPSSMTKASLAQRHNCTLSVVNSWFANARRRMGWTALCRNYFGGCRSDALDAAHRALVKEDPNRQLSADIIHAFISVKVVAEGLYSSTLTKSALASDLDTILKDMSDQENVPLNEQRHVRPQGTTELSKTLNTDPQNKTLVAQNYYSSPDRSRFSPPVPTLDDSLTDSGDILPPSLTSRKRTHSSSEVVHAFASESTTRLKKRPRSSFSSTNACLLSPATSGEECLGNDQMPRTDPTTPDFTSFETRKRRLSDANVDRLRKRQRGSVAESRPHAVSDPLPLSIPESEYSIDEWFKANFDALFALPPPADVTEPDVATQWDIELFNNYDIPGNLQKNLSFPIQDNQTPSTDLTALDHLFQSFENDAFVSPPEVTYAPTVTSIPGSVSQGLSPLPDLSQPIDWTTLLNEDPYKLSNNSLFPPSYVNSTLAEIDLAILQLPQVWTPVTS